MTSTIAKLIDDIGAGSALDAIEAAKKIPDLKIDDAEIFRLNEIAVTGSEIHNKEAAVYALSWIQNNNIVLEVLISILSSIEWINGRDGKKRIPVSIRVGKSKES